ncbi:MAG: exodeoxyribonuclease VII large subunit, partial [Candidatus Dormibacterales bacterium]
MLNAEEGRRPWTVSELAQQIRQELRPLANVIVKGEVSGIRQSGRGHLGFTVKDEASLIEAMIWADTARRLPLLPEDGQEFIFQGRVDFWPQGGRLRLIVERLEFDDVGRLRARLERLKQQLEAEGAFEAARKRPIPFLPRRVALVTSPTGAVIHDLQETILDRYPTMAVAVYPAQVQGTASPASVVAALRRCNHDADCGVVVIARGGGSFEELYAFNTEAVARAILASQVPVVTALGHTSDRTLADMVADAECRTPTEAGARVVPRHADLKAQMAQR